MGPSGTLSTKDYWDKTVKGAKLPRFPDILRHNIRAIVDSLDPVLKCARAKTLIEVGCAASEWLPYFAKRYGYRVSGLDYSETGCALAAENLRLHGVEYEKIVCTDLLEWKSIEKYDVVVSFGVIEHFVSSGEILKIFAKHLNEGGLVITVVPNLRGAMGLLARLVVPEIYRMHRALSLEDMLRFNNAAGLTEVKTVYAGIFSLGTIPWGKSGRYLFSGASRLGRASLRIINQLDKLFSLALNRFRKPTSALFSPYIISVSRARRVEHHAK